MRLMTRRREGLASPPPPVQTPPFMLRLLECFRWGYVYPLTPALSPERGRGRKVYSPPRLGEDSLSPPPPIANPALYAESSRRFPVGATFTPSPRPSPPKGGGGRVGLLPLPRLGEGLLPPPPIANPALYAEATEGFRWGPFTPSPRPSPEGGGGWGLAFPLSRLG